MAYFNIQQCFALIGVSPDADERQIRRAYAIKLKQIDPEADPAAFQALHESYQVLLEWVRHKESSPPSRVVPEPVNEAEIESPSRQSIELAVASEHLDATHHQNSQPESAVSQTATDAEKVFAEMAAKFESRLADTTKQIVAKARQILTSTLQHPALISIDTKDYFEWCVARHLAQGWRPGNEAMFEAAIAEFRWAEEPKRLMRFPHVAGFINAAINERFAFNEQHPTERKNQLAVLRHLRSKEEPSHRVLIHQMKRTEYVATRFPNLLALVSDPGKIASWQAAAKKVPGWKRAFSFVAPIETGQAQKTAEDSGWGSWFWKAVAFLVVISTINNVFKSPMQPVVPKALPSSFMSEQRVKEPNLLLEEMAKSKARTKLDFPSAEEIKKKYSGRATFARCNEAYDLGLRLQLDSSFPGDTLGPVYDRYVSNCAIGKLWPSNPQAARISRPALDRYIAVLKADTKKTLEKAIADSKQRRKVENSATSEAAAPRESNLRSGNDAFGSRYAQPHLMDEEQEND